MLDRTPWSAYRNKELAMKFDDFAPDVLMEIIARSPLVLKNGTGLL